MSDVIPLDEICKTTFGLCIQVARQRAAKQLLPIPVFKFNNSKRAPYFVKKDALEKYMNECIKNGLKEWESVNK
jgi:glutamate formiminotransferase